VTAFAALMVVAAVAAAVDWVAVGTSNKQLEYLAKPAVLAALMAAAAAIPAGRIDLVDRRWWFVAALGACLAGDVLLMLPGELFVPGLAAFLAGHALFIGGFLQPPSPDGGPPFSFSPTGLITAAVLVVVVESVPAALIIRSLSGEGRRGLVVPVVVYMAAVVTMAVLACNVGNAVAAVGALLFLASDTVLAFDRFVVPVPRGHLVVHVTYHLGQALLVLSLLG
jgi:uncharacterized membrane protein YhhN